MARTYSPANLVPHDPTSLAWALAWARRFAGDVPLGDAWRLSSLEDKEWQAWLQATAVQHGGTTYYRPHEAAARAIESDPNRLLSLSLAGVAQSYRTPQEAASAIRRAGAWVDDLIAQATLSRPGEVRPVW